jgi:pyruvate carboxylase
VIDMLRGNLGQPPGGFPPAIIAKVLKDETPNTERPGKHLKAQDIEAMKMETGIHVDHDAVVKAVHVRPGDQIDAKDLLVELE